MCIPQMVGSGTGSCCFHWVTVVKLENVQHEPVMEKRFAVKVKVVPQHCSQHVSEDTIQMLFVNVFFPSDTQLPAGH